MKITEFLANQNIRPATFADEIQVSPSTVTRWARGERRPNVVMLGRIKAATNGAVTADDFLPAPTSRSA